MLNNAHALNDLRVPPANRLERLAGDRAGQYSIRINDRWRVCFDWRAGDVYDVEIGDYQLEKASMKENKVHPVHPREVLLEEFLKPMKLSQNRLALDIGVHPRRINEIVLGKRSITADTALRLARYFGTSPQLWLGPQADYDLDIAMDELGDRLEKEVKTYVAVG
jgi:antitoxin HigA-1